MTRGFSINGLNHLGLVVEDIEKAKKWFIDTLEFKLIEDRGEIFFFLIGNDIVAAKTPKMAISKPEYGETKATEAALNGWQHLDHYGFYANSKDEVDAFAEFLLNHGVEILKGPYDRSDGRSVYFRDPVGLVGEYLFYAGK